MADPKENVLLQGYAVTTANASEQAIITQGYDYTQFPSGGASIDVIYVRAMGQGHTSASSSVVNR